MTQQWQLSGNAENVDWSDLAMAGRAYADNLVGEPAVSNVMHMMADEIERLRASVRPKPYEKSYEKRVLYDTKRGTSEPRNGALSGCETVPDADSRVWETPCTPPPQATPPQSSVRGDGSVPRSGTENEPVAWANFFPDEEMVHFDRDYVEQCSDEGEVVPLYRSPHPTLTDEEREAVETAIATLAAYRYATLPAAAEALRKLLERMK